MTCDNKTYNLIFWRCVRWTKHILAERVHSEKSLADLFFGGKRRRGWNELFRCFWPGMPKTKTRAQIVWKWLMNGHFDCEFPKGLQRLSSFYSMTSHFVNFCSPPEKLSAFPKIPRTSLAKTALPLEFVKIHRTEKYLIELMEFVFLLFSPSLF